MYKPYSSFDDIAGLSRPQTPELAKVGKNDVRRHISSMFVSALNSGDFNQIQSFLFAFMSVTSTFFVNMPLSREFQISPIIAGQGPQQFAHYILGLHVMFPDLIIKLLHTQIVTSTLMTETKITMEVEICMTKMAHVPMEVWVPPLDRTPQLYQAQDLLSMMSAVQSIKPEQSTSVTPMTTATSCSDTAGSLTQHSSYLWTNPASVDDLQDLGDENIMDFLERETQEQDCAVQSTAAGADDSWCYDPDEEDPPAPFSAATATSPAVYPAPQQQVPISFISTLYNHAPLLASPLPLQLRGQYVLLLDPTSRSIVRLSFSASA